MKRIIIFLAAAAVLGVLSFAQTRSGDIYGSVYLDDGSRVPGVLVTLTGETFGTQTTRSSAKGNFRFPGLPPGDYRLSCELKGFKTVIRKGIEVNLGKSVSLDILMGPAKLTEEIVVTGHVGMIDTRKANLAANVTKEMVESLPTARNPWTVLSILPGMMVDRVDIGGADSGQQSYYLTGGTDRNDGTWNVDGANITHPNYPGAASAYLNINAYEELQVTMGSNDITAQTGGTHLNFVTRRGGNKTSGDFHIYMEDKAWEMHQEPTPYMKEAGLVVPGADRMYMYGINLGGSIIKDRLWWFGSWAVQDIHKRTEANLEDGTWLVSAYGKLHFQLGDTGGHVHMSYDSKKKWGRTWLSPSQQDADSLVDQDSPVYFFYGALSHNFGDLLLNGRAVISESDVAIGPRGADFNPETGHSEGKEFKIIDGYSSTEGSAWEYSAKGKTVDITLDGNYFTENVLGCDHEIKFGAGYYNTDWATMSLTPNQRIAYIYRSDPSLNFLSIAPDTITDVNFKRISAYVQDSVTFGRFAVTFGLRYDREQGRVNPFTQPYFTWYEPGSPYHGERMFADKIPALVSGGFKVPGAWRLLSPRLSLIYDIAGDGKNVVKLTAGRYMSQGGNTAAVNYIPERYGYAAWSDSNADEIPQYGEVGELYWYDPFTQLDPVSGLNIVSYDENYNTPLLDELTLTFEKQLAEDLVVSVTGFLKKRHNLASDVNSRGEIVPVRRGIMADGSLEAKSNWEQTGTVEVGGTTVPVYQRIETPVGYHYYNLDKAYDLYRAVQLELRKKFSPRWMLNVSFTYQDWRLHRFEDETLDMNNFDFFNGGQAAPVSSGSGLSDLWINSRWMFKLTGIYRLPWGVDLSAFFFAREGYPQPLRRVMYLSQGSVYLYRRGYKSGDERLPTLWMLHLGLEKSVRVAETVRAVLVLDWYNATNNQIVQKYNLNIGADPVDGPRPVMWTQAGLFQFGVRVHF